MKSKMTFVDLFAGIGGFHQALKQLGCVCVCASEIDEKCIEVYKTNFPNVPILGDINENINNIPNFDVLCGGFPCQPFSKAGKQEGFNDKTRGNLFYRIMDIIKLHPECKFVILENVKNLADNTENWDLIQNALKDQNFYVTDKPIILSPHMFGIPQIRERVYILGIRKDIRDEIKLPNGSIHMEDLGKIFNFNKHCGEKEGRKILDKEFDKKYIVSKTENEVIRMWQEFKVITEYSRIGVPIWVEYFGYGLKDNEYKLFVDHNGKQVNELPKWKQRFAKNNRELYLKYKKQIDKWIKKYNVIELPLVYKKLEWNCGEEKNIEKTIIQFRQSGVRVKKFNYFPALVAIKNTPIIYDERHKLFRYITVREAANLQSFDKDYIFPQNNDSYKQLGNAVNVEIIKMLAEILFSFEKEANK